MLNKLFKAHKNNREDGFTLIELLIVIVIIGILAAIAIPVFSNQQAAAQNARVISDAKNSEIAVETALVNNPQAAGFTVLGPNDTAASISILKGAAIPVPSGNVALHLTASANNVAVLTDTSGVSSAAATGTNWLIHVQNPATGFWAEYSSATGLLNSANKTGAVPVVAISRITASTTSITPVAPLSPCLGSNADAAVTCDVDNSRNAILNNLVTNPVLPATNPNIANIISASQGYTRSPYTSVIFYTAATGFVFPGTPTFCVAATAYDGTSGVYFATNTRVAQRVTSTNFLPTLCHVNP